MSKSADKFAKSEDFDYAEHVGQWHGADVFIAGFKEPCDVGLPQYILEKDGKVRWATVEETSVLMSEGII